MSSVRSAITFTASNRISRRAFLGRTAWGLGTIALGGLLSHNSYGDDGGSSSQQQWPGLIHPLHYPPRAKRVIWLGQMGGPSQFETFDFKPKLPRYRGITYFFTLMSKDTELVVKNKELLQRQVTSAVLVNPESKENIALGLVMTYCYRDLAGKTLIEFDVDKNSKIDQSLKDAPDILSQGLIVAAENINKTTPRMLDESTRLDSAKAKPDGLNYNYTLIGMSDADAMALKANTEEQTSKNLHAKLDTEKLLEQGATLTFNYSNAAGKRLFTFDVKK